MTRHLAPFMSIAPHVHRALVRGEPVVALESSLVAHGFPPPHGLEVALAAEEQVRRHGALAATVAVLDGAVRVGLDEAQIRRLASEPDVRKVGPRDLAACAVSGRTGGTTVAGTLAACRIAGVHFFATGGIGGVHRGWSRTLDVSPDVYELAQVPACVVCSGAKSLLDVPATLEMLESLGVPVIGYGTDTLPLFLSRDGGPLLTDRADDPETVATVAAAHWGFARSTGVVVAQPPAPEAAVPFADVQPIVEQALREAQADGSAGATVTPRVLAALHRESDGRTLAANRRLIEDNAALAARVAVAYYAS